MGRKSAVLELPAEVRRWLEREGYVQLAYKHAVSTIQPASPVDLTGDADEDSDD